MKRKLKKKPLSFVKKNLVLILGCFVLLTLSTIGYAALNQALNITGDIAIRAIKDVRITNVALTSTSGDGYEYYNSSYGTDSITISAVLPNVDSSISYTAEVSNRGNVDMEVAELNAEIQTSLVAQLSTLAKTQYFECNVEGMSEGDVILAGETKEFVITFKRIADSSDNFKNVEAIIELKMQEHFSDYIDPILAGNTPNLLNNNLVPVMYDEDYYGKGNGSWIVADTKTEWYNYSNQMWANAVILEDGVTKKAGDPIMVPTDVSTATEITAMYVWIPRYSYTIKSEDGTNYYGKTLSELNASTASEITPGAIDIKFVNTITKETGTAQYTGNTASNWLTHPAFTFGTEELTGIWVGKFETTGSSSVPTILPNSASLVNQNNFGRFTTSQLFATYLNDSTGIDAHMMKNSEWGAVAYLSQSIYGKYGNLNYSGMYKEIYPNDSNKYTGRSYGTIKTNNTYSWVTQEGTYKYNSFPNKIIISTSGEFEEYEITDDGLGASTTGTIYGIYDMSGGMNEAVMALYVSENNAGNVYIPIGSGTEIDVDNGIYVNYAGFEDGWFDREENKKYYDAYTGKLNCTTTEYGGGYKYESCSPLDIKTMCNGDACRGHALSETGPWYQNLNVMESGFEGTNPWVLRGGVIPYYEALKPGIFAVGNNDGGNMVIGSFVSFRSVLVME